MKIHYISNRWSEEKKRDWPYCGDCKRFLEYDDTDHFALSAPEKPIIPYFLKKHEENMESVARMFEEI